MYIRASLLALGALAISACATDTKKTVQLPPFPETYIPVVTRSPVPNDMWWTEPAKTDPSIVADILDVPLATYQIFINVRVNIANLESGKKLTVELYDRKLSSSFTASGSGYVVSAQGHLVTNEHVVGAQSWVRHVCTTLQPKYEGFNFERLEVDLRISVPKENQKEPEWYFGDYRVVPLQGSNICDPDKTQWIEQDHDPEWIEYLGGDKKADTAVLLLPKGKMPYRFLAFDEPGAAKVDDAFILFGYYADGTRALRTRMISLCRIAHSIEDKISRASMEFQTVAESGMSGGPVLSPKTVSVAGTIWGSQAGNGTAAANAETVRSFLNALRNPTARWAPEATCPEVTSADASLIE